jgi:FtsZ-binding cell division protein ZapB
MSVGENELSKLRDKIKSLSDTNANLHIELDKRNEATKVWIQYDTQTRAYCNQLEREIEFLKSGK